MTKQTRWGLRRLAGLALPALLVGVITGCDLDSFLDIEDPEVVSPGGVQDPSALPVVYRGVIRDFTWAYSGTGSIGGGGDHDSHIMLSGLFTDELQHTGTFPTRRLIDRRAIQSTGEHGTADNGTISDAYRNLHKARRAAEQAEELYAAADAGPSSDRSVVSSIEGFTYILFGELYCEGVPYSSRSIDGATVTFGTPSTRQETFNRAITAFDRAKEHIDPLIASAEQAIAEANQAIADAEDDDERKEAEADKQAAEKAKAAAESIQYLARVGKARALLNLGDAQAAAAEVSVVPDEWEFAIEHSANSSGENNGVWKYSLDAGRYGVLDNEGENGLVWSGDDRTPVVVDPIAAFDGEIDEFVAQNKYPTRDAPVVLADGREARLIEAEAAIGTGAFIGFINAARAVDGLDPLADPGANAHVDLLFSERGYALWLTAHRLGDLRRMIRDYGYDAEEVFPTGEYFRDGLQYGTDVNFPIYVDEVNNPNFTGCLNRDA